MKIMFAILAASALAALASAGCCITTGYELATAKMRHQHCGEECQKRHRMQEEYLVADPMYGPGYKLKGALPR